MIDRHTYRVHGALRNIIALADKAKPLLAEMDAAIKAGDLDKRLLKELNAEPAALLPKTLAPKKTTIKKPATKKVVTKKPAAKKAAKK